MNSSAKGLLGGLRVVDLADEKGAFCIELLGDLGAAIIKWGAPPDPKDSAAIQMLRSRIDGADVVVESRAPGSMERLGLGFEALQAGHPGLIMASISGFGQTGPRRNDLSCDLIAAATGGQAYITGSPKGPPQAPFGKQTYYTASLFAAVGILAALQGRKRTGRGRHIDISLQEAALATLDHVMVRYIHESIVASRQGGRHWDGLFALLPCRDGLIHLTPIMQWDNLVEWLDSEGMAADLRAPQWQDDTYRRDHMDHILDVLAAWTRSHTTEELFQLGQSMGFAWAPVASPAQVIASPQLEARGFRRSQAGDSPDAGRRSGGLPFGAGIAPADDRLPIPPGAAGHDPCSPAPYSQSFGPLRGLRVLDFTRVLAGPFATRMLADLGAEVIKVQTGKTAVGAEDNARPFFSRWNRNKLGITLDLNHPEARALALDLAAASDVVVENFSPRVMANWDLSHVRLQRINPRIIMVSMSGMGHSGPWKDFTAFAPTIHSLSGHTFLNRGPGGEPVGLGFAYADIVSGLYAALAVLAALDHRHRTGLGQFIDLSEYEAACTLLEPALLAVQAGQAKPPGSPYADIQAAPYGCYPCRGRDRWCAIAVLNESQWQALTEVLGPCAWMHGGRFSSLAFRKRRAADLDQRLSRLTIGWTAEDLSDRLQRSGVPAGVVQTAADLARDPHLIARGVFTSLTHPVLGKIMTDRHPIRFMGERPCPWQAAPLLGQHNAYVFRKLLGLREDRFEQYQERGVIA